MNKKGFIATSLIYSFFLIFCALLLSYVGVYLHNTVLFNKQRELINKDIYQSYTIKDTNVGSYYSLYIGSSYKITEESSETINYLAYDTYPFTLYRLDISSKIAYFISDDIIFTGYTKKGITNMVESVTLQNTTYKARLVEFEDIKYIIENYNNLAQRIVNLGYNGDSANTKYVISDGEELYRYTVEKEVSDNIENNTIKEANKVEDDVIVDANKAVGARLIIAVKSGMPIISGDGTANNRFIIGTIK